jgi:hypothetical protein
MLRITMQPANDSSRRLKLEGKLLEPWLEELRRACAEAVSPEIPLHLDLAGITFVDAAGAQLLRELIHQGVTLVRCSGFVTVLLQGENR